MQTQATYCPSSGMRFSLERIDTQNGMSIWWRDERANEAHERANEAHENSYLPRHQVMIY